VTYEVLYVDENNVLIDRVDFGEINCNEIDNLSSLGEDIATPVYASVLSEDYQDIRYFYINETFVSTDETTNKTVENLNEPSLEWNYNIYQDGTVFGHSTGAGLLFAVPLVFATAIVIFAVSYIRKMD
jgi:aspartokinase